MERFSSLPTPPNYNPPSSSHTAYTTPGGVVCSDVQHRGGVSMVTSDEQGPSLVEMLNRIDALDTIPRLQINGPPPVAGQSQEVVGATKAGGEAPPTQTEGHGSRQDAKEEVVANATPPSTQASTGIQTSSKDLSQNLIVQLPAEVSTEVSIPSSEKKSKAGRPRTRPTRDHQEWHYHLGGVRHSRVPLSPELKEVLEVAYVSRIMSKNFRKEGQPEKERIARITGMDIDKVQEWFKNRRKKDKLNKDRERGIKPLPKLRRGQTSPGFLRGGVSTSPQTLSTQAKLGMVTMEIDSGAIVTTTTPTQPTQTVPITMDTILMKDLPHP